MKRNNNSCNSLTLLFLLPLFALLSCDDQPFKAGLGAVVDTRPPTVALTEPGVGNTIFGRRTFTGFAEDDYKIERVELMVTNYTSVQTGYLTKWTPVTLQKSVQNKGNWFLSIDTTQFKDGDLKIRLRAFDSVRAEPEVTDELIFTVRNDVPKMTLTSPSILEDEFGGYGAITPTLTDTYLNYKTTDALPLSIDYQRALEPRSPIAGTIEYPEGIWTEKFDPDRPNRYPPQIRRWRVTATPINPAPDGIREYAPGEWPPESEVPWEDFSYGDGPLVLTPIGLDETRGIVTRHLFSTKVPETAGFYGFELRAQSEDGRVKFRYPRDFWPWYEENDYDWENPRTADMTYDYLVENRYVLVYVRTTEDPTTVSFWNREDILGEENAPPDNHVGNDYKVFTNNYLKPDEPHPFVDTSRVDKNGSFTIRAHAKHSQGIEGALLFWESANGRRGVFIWDKDYTDKDGLLPISPPNPVLTVPVPSGSDVPFSHLGFKDPLDGLEHNFIFSYNHKTPKPGKIWEYEGGNVWDTIGAIIAATSPAGLIGWKQYDGTLWEDTYTITAYAVSTTGANARSLERTVRLDFTAPVIDPINAIIGALPFERNVDTTPPVDAVVNGVIEPRLRRIADSGDSVSGMRTAINTYYYEPGTTTYGHEKRYLLVQDKTEMDKIIANPDNGGPKNYWPTVPNPALPSTSFTLPKQGTGFLTVFRHGPVYPIGSVDGFRFKTSAIYGGSPESAPLADGEYWLYVCARDNAFNVGWMDPVQITVVPATDIPTINVVNLITTDDPTGNGVTDPNYLVEFETTGNGTSNTSPIGTGSTRYFTFAGHGLAVGDTVVVDGNKRYVLWVNGNNFKLSNAYTWPTNNAVWNPPAGNITVFASKAPGSFMYMGGTNKLSANAGLRLQLRDDDSIDLGTLTGSPARDTSIKVTITGVTQNATGVVTLRTGTDYTRAVDKEVIKERFAPSSTATATVYKDATIPQGALVDALFGSAGDNPYSYLFDGGVKGSSLPDGIYQIEVEVSDDRDFKLQGPDENPAESGTVETKTAHKTIWLFVDGTKPELDVEYASEQVKWIQDTTITDHATQEAWITSLPTTNPDTTYTGTSTGIRFTGEVSDRNGPVTVKTFTISDNAGRTPWGTLVRADPAEVDASIVAGFTGNGEEYRATFTAPVHIDSSVSGDFTVTLTVVDRFGNETSYKQQYKRDKSPPTVTLREKIRLVERGAYTDLVNGIVSFEYSAQDDLAVNEVRYWLIEDGTTFTGWNHIAFTNPAPWQSPTVNNSVMGKYGRFADFSRTVFVNTTLLKNNTRYNLYVMAADDGGNISELPTPTPWLQTIRVQQDSDVPFFVSNTLSGSAGANLRANITIEDDDTFYADRNSSAIRNLSVRIRATTTTIPDSGNNWTATDDGHMTTYGYTGWYNVPPGEITAIDKRITMSIDFKEAFQTLLGNFTGGRVHYIIEATDSWVDKFANEDGVLVTAATAGVATPETTVTLSHLKYQRKHYTFESDLAPPKATITAPAADTIYGATGLDKNNNGFAVSGAISDGHLKMFESNYIIGIQVDSRDLWVTTPPSTSDLKPFKLGTGAGNGFISTIQPNTPASGDTQVNFTILSSTFLHATNGINYASLPDGRHTLVLVAEDESASRGSSPSLIFYKDTTAPTFAFTRGFNDDKTPIPSFNISTDNTPNIQPWWTAVSSINSWYGNQTVRDRYREARDTLPVITYERLTAGSAYTEDTLPAITGTFTDERSNIKKSSFKIIWDNGTPGTDDKIIPSIQLGEDGKTVTWKVYLTADGTPADAGTTNPILGDGVHSIRLMVEDEVGNAMQYGDMYGFRIVSSTPKSLLTQVDSLPTKVSATNPTPPPATIQVINPNLRTVYGDRAGTGTSHVTTSVFTIRGEGISPNLSDVRVRIRRTDSNVGRVFERSVLTAGATQITGDTTAAAFAPAPLGWSVDADGDKVVWTLDIRRAYVQYAGSTAAPAAASLIPSGEYEVMVIAVDSAGKVSEESDDNKWQFTIDIAPPTFSFNLPNTPTDTTVSNANRSPTYWLTSNATRDLRNVLGDTPSIRGRVSDANALTNYVEIQLARWNYASAATNKWEIYTFSTGTWAATSDTVLNNLNNWTPLPPTAPATAYSSEYSVNWAFTNNGTSTAPAATPSNITMANGYYSVRLRARDISTATGGSAGWGAGMGGAAANNGNPAASHYLYFFIDTKGPDLAAPEGEPATFSSRYLNEYKVTFNITATDPNMFESMIASVEGTSISAPVSGDPVRSGNGTWTASATIALKPLEVIPATGSRPLTGGADGLADGSYKIVFTATDLAGKTSKDTRTITLDNRAPTGAITEPRFRGTVSVTPNGTPTHRFASEIKTGGEPFTITGTSADSGDNGSATGPEQVWYRIGYGTKTVAELQALLNGSETANERSAKIAAWVENSGDGLTGFTTTANGTNNDVQTGTRYFTYANHGLAVGNTVRVVTTDRYVLWVNGNNFKLSNTYTMDSPGTNVWDPAAGNITVTIAYDRGKDSNFAFDAAARKTAGSLWFKYAVTGASSAFDVPTHFTDITATDVLEHPYSWVLTAGLTAENATAWVATNYARGAVSLRGRNFTNGANTTSNVTQYLARVIPTGTLPQDLVDYGLYSLPLVIRVVDKAGNVFYELRDIWLYPNGDNPRVTTFLNPADRVTNVTAPRGGQFNIDGIAQDNRSIRNVIYRVRTDATSNTTTNPVVPGAPPANNGTAFTATGANTNNEIQNNTRYFTYANHGLVVGDTVVVGGNNRYVLWVSGDNFKLSNAYTWPTTAVWNPAAGNQSIAPSNIVTTIPGVKWESHPEYNAMLAKWNSYGANGANVTESNSATALNKAGWYVATLDTATFDPVMPWNFMINSAGEISNRILSRGFKYPTTEANNNTIRVWVDVLVFDGSEAASGGVYNRMSLGGGTDADNPRPYVREFYLTNAAPSITAPQISDQGGTTAFSAYTSPLAENNVRSGNFAVRATVSSTTKDISLIQVRLRNDPDNSDWRTVGTTLPNGVTRTWTTNNRVATLTYAFSSTATGSTTALQAVRNGEWARSGGTMTVDIRVTDSSAAEATYTFEVGVDNFYPLADTSKNITPTKVAGTNVNFFGRAFDYHTDSEIAEDLPSLPAPVPVHRKITAVHAWFTRFGVTNQYINMETGVPGSATTAAETNVWSSPPATITWTGTNNNDVNTITSTGAPEPITSLAIPTAANYVKVITESSGSGTTWSPSKIGVYEDVYWSFTQDTTKLPDGWITMHYVVVDQAGNRSYYNQSMIVMNNYPQITKVTLWTNNTGEGAVFTTHDGNEAKSEYDIPEPGRDAEYNVGEYRYASGYLNSGFISKNNVIGFGVDTIKGNPPLKYQARYVERYLVPLTRLNMIAMAGGGGTLSHLPNTVTLNAQGVLVNAAGTAVNPVPGTTSSSGFVNLYTIATANSLPPSGATGNGSLSAETWKLLGAPSTNPVAGSHFVFQAVNGGGGDNDVNQMGTATGFANVYVYAYREVLNTAAVTPSPNNTIAPEQLNFDGADYFGGTDKINESQANNPTNATQALPAGTAYFLIKVWDTVNGNPAPAGTPAFAEKDMLYDAVVIGMKVYVGDTRAPRARLYELNPYAEMDVIGGNSNTSFRQQTLDAAAAPYTDGEIGENIKRGSLYNIGTENAPIKSGYIEPRFGNGAANSSAVLNQYVNRPSDPLNPYTGSRQERPNGFVTGSSDAVGTTTATGGSPDKVSGSVILRGLAWDDQLVKTISINIGGTSKTILTLWYVLPNGNKYTTNTPTAAQITANNLTRKMMPETGVQAWAFENIHWQTGHTVEWAYLWNTETEPSGRARGGPANVNVAVEVLDANGNNKTGLPNVAYTVPGAGRVTTPTPAPATVTPPANFHNAINVDIVPYVVGFKRAERFATTRSRQGWYSFFQGESGIAVLGYNLGDSGRTMVSLSATQATGGTNLTMAYAANTNSPNDGHTFTIPANAASSRINVRYTPASGDATQAYNNNDPLSIHATKSWNRENSDFINGSDLWTNKRYAHIWRTTESATLPATYFGDNTGSGGSHAMESPSMVLEYGTTSGTTQGTGTGQMTSGYGATPGRLHGVWAHRSTFKTFYAANDNNAAIRLQEAQDPQSYTDLAYYPSANNGNNLTAVYVYQWDSLPNLILRTHMKYLPDGADALGLNPGGTIVPFLIMRENRGDPTETVRWQNVRTSTPAANVNDGSDNSYTPHGGNRDTQNEAAQRGRSGRVYTSGYDSVSNNVFFVERIGSINYPSPGEGGQTNSRLPLFIDGGTAATGVNNMSVTGLTGYTATTTSSRAGSWSAIDYVTNGGTNNTTTVPVIAYFDEANDTIRLAYGSVNGTGTDGANGTGARWTRRYVLPSDHKLFKSSGKYVSMKVDKNNFIHLAFYNSNYSAMVYAVGTRTGAFTAYIVDNVVAGGTWTDISVDNSSTNTVPSNPWIVYGDSGRSGNYDGVRIAYKGPATGTGAFTRAFTDPVTGATLTGWEALTMPADYTIADDRLNIESWPPTDRRATTATLPDASPNGGWHAAVGYAGTGGTTKQFRIGYFIKPPTALQSGL